MCQSLAEGGRRCTGTPTGKALFALYRERKNHPDRAERITDTITRVRAAEKLYGGRFVTPFEMELPEGVHAVLDDIRAVGNPLVVGGAVRDAAFGASNKDIDIEVFGTSLEELTSALRSAGYSVDEVGKQFGVLKVSRKGGVRDLDIAVPRRENAVGAGHRDFEVSHDSNLSVTDAAERRDFTINALSYDPRLGVLVDPFHGSDDLRSRTLRAVSEKFTEDPLRVLRGVQFAGRFGLTIDPETALMCQNLRTQYTALAKERVADEWMKLYTKGTHADAALSVLRETGWDDTLPGLATASRDPEVVDSLSALGTVPSDYRASMGAALLSRNMSEEDRRGFIDATTVGGATAKLARALVDTDPESFGDTYSRKRRALESAKIGWTWTRYRDYARIIGDTAGVRAADAAIAEGVGTTPEPAWVQGRDVLQRTDRKPGPWLGALVNEALDKQYRGEFPDKPAAVNWAVNRAGED